jgi:hypothetical protein
MNDGSISKELYTFFAAYFHQDWDLEADDWHGVVNNYINADPISEPLRKLAREIDDLRSARAEQELKHFLLRTVGVNYIPDSVTYGEWLSQIADFLRLRASQIDSGSLR